MSGNPTEPPFPPGEGLTRPTHSLAPPAAKPEVAGAAASPSRIGRYRIIGVIGEGGMGTVFEAEQEQPRRSVALKVIRGGYVSAEMIRRFEHESHVLGRLQHPGIAQVYEAGVVEDEHGRPTPFFAMEHIRGTSLTKFADEKGLGSRQRMELIARVCDAVEHAHQKGVIHRDLKPGNILVDESGQPKILDFGVARATDSDVQQTTMRTDVGQLLGTVPYMSPEQVGGDPGELDTRSDVYALGVIAYELLAGRPPYDLARKMIHEAARVIREEEPTRLSSINKTLRGDVETIVGKALEKEKSRRYQSADALGSDIRRYLHDEPIAARPAGTWYQASKFARRHKGLVGGLGAAIALLVAGLVGTTYGMKQAYSARDDAREKLDLATTMDDFMRSALRSGNPASGGKSDMLVSDAMMQALRRLDAGQFEQTPQIEASMRMMIADILHSAGRPREATPVAEQGVAIYRRVRPEGHPDIAQSLGILANCLASDGRAEAGLTAARESLDLVRRFEPDDDLKRAARLNTVSIILDDLGRYEEGLPLHREALEIYRSHYPGDHEAITVALNNLGYCLVGMRKPDEAKEHFEQSLEMNRRLYPPDHPDIAYGLHNIGTCQKHLGDLEGALANFRAAAEVNAKAFGRDHPHTATSISSAAECLSYLGRHEESLVLNESALAMRQRLFDGDRLATASSLNNKAYDLRQLQRYPESLELFRQALEMHRRIADGEDSPEVEQAVSNYGSTLAAAGEFEEAAAQYAEAIEMVRRLYPDDPQKLYAKLDAASACLRSLKKYREATPYLREMVSIRDRLFPGDTAERRLALSLLGFALRASGEFVEALAVFEEALRIGSVLWPNGSANLAVDHNNVAACSSSLKQFENARVHYEAAMEVSRRAVGTHDPSTLNYQRYLSGVLYTLREYDSALALAAQALEFARVAYPAGHQNLKEFEDRVALIERRIEDRRGAETQSPGE